LTNESAFGSARSTIKGAPLSPETVARMHGFWRACNYLAVGMIYLRDNPLLLTPLAVEHVKKRLLGHWGSSPAIAVYRRPRAGSVSQRANRLSPVRP
jgi:xylulose-5-phosphate/fructose-6-phosphate phosphoketolase